MKTLPGDALIAIFSDIPDVYMCPECENIWTSNGRQCDHSSQAVKVSPYELLHNLTKLIVEKVAPPRVPSIRDAYEAINLIAPDDQPISISMDLWWHTHNGKRKETPEVQFEISVAGSGPSYYGPTLDAAVQPFVAAHQPPASEEGINAFVTEAEALVPPSTHKFEEKCGQCQAEYAARVHAVAYERLERHEFVPTGMCFHCNELKDDPIHTKE